MSFHFKLLGAQYFKKLQRNIVEKKLEKQWWQSFLTAEKVCGGKNIICGPKVQKKNVRKSATTSPTTKLWQIKMLYAPVNATHT